VQRLIELRTPPEGKRPSYEQVARSINEGEGRSVISGPYVWELATGKTTNPRIHHLEALAKWAGTDLRYFFDSDYATRVEPQLMLLAQLKESGVLNVALRARDLSDSSREHLGAIIDHLRSLEGLEADKTDESGC
jgi:transcriptional regulator with XRE-family HTH domain